MALKNTSGKITFLRVHEVQSKFGPPSDSLDAEVIFKLDTDKDLAFGFQLRNDNNSSVREGMLDLLRDAFNFGWIVNTDFEIENRKKNGRATRIWLTKPKTVPPGTVRGGTIRADAGRIIQ
ncbi:hypothetical protein MNBD_GAMMA10-2203 [hydrothermal vent metagenome]|uniref:Uncharacterized protein n=1 Tax=hydrothermal vent metagenome TaxID=652676 RepID=A0A3B0Y8B8_9ZZZZ